MAKNRRVLDKDFEEGITNRAGELRDDARDAITMARKEAQSDIAKAQDYAYKRNDEIEAMIKEHPKAFVLGSFIGGVALGTLLARGNR